MEVIFILFCLSHCWHFPSLFMFQTCNIWLLYSLSFFQTYILNTSVNIPCVHFSVQNGIHEAQKQLATHTACCDFMVILLMHSLKHLFVWWLSGVRLQSLILSGFYHSSASLSPITGHPAASPATVLKCLKAFSPSALLFVYLFIILPFPLYGRL